MKLLKRLNRPLVFLLACMLLLSSVSLSSPKGAPTDKTAKILPRFPVFKGKTLTVFGKTHHSMSFYQVENDSTIVGATLCLEAGKKLWDGTECAFEKYEVKPGQSVPYIGSFDRYLSMVLAYEWMAWEGPYPEAIRYGVVQIYYWGCMAGYEEDWEAQEEAMQQFSKVMGSPSVMTYYYDMKDYIIQRVNDYDIGNISLPTWNGSQQKMELKDGQYELILDISSCPKLRSTIWSFPDNYWGYRISPDGNNISFQYSGPKEPQGRITSADIPGIENKYYAYIFNPPSGLQPQMGRLNLDSIPSNVSFEVNPFVPHTPIGSHGVELYRHSETFQSNYNIELEKYCAETNQPLEGTTFNVWEDFDQSQINQGDYTEGEPDGATGEVYLNGMSPQPESGYICDAINTDTNGKARHNDVRYYNYSKTYCMGHPAPDWVEIPEQETDEVTGECTNQGDIDAAQAENDRLRQQWMAEQELCQATCDFHASNHEESNHEQDTQAMEAMLADRDETYENFTRLEYSYHLEEKTARTGYALHGRHNDDAEIETVIITSAQNGGSLKSGSQRTKLLVRKLFEPIYRIVSRMDSLRGYIYPVPEGQDATLAGQRDIVSVLKEKEEKPPDEIPKESSEADNLGANEPESNNPGAGDSESEGQSTEEPAAVHSETPIASKVIHKRRLLYSSIATGNDASKPDMDVTETPETEPSSDTEIPADTDPAGEFYEEYQYIRNPVHPSYVTDITYMESLREPPNNTNVLMRFFTSLFSEDEGGNVTGTLPEFMDDDLETIDTSAYGGPGTILYTFKVWDHRTEGRIHINKRDLELYRADEDGSYGQSQGDGTLEGAVYGLFAAQDLIHPDGKSGIVYNRNDLAAVAATDRQGDASFLAFTEKPGTCLDADGNIKAPDGVTGPKSLYDGSSIISSSEGFGTVAYPDYVAANGNQWIGRPLLMGNYYIMELSRSEGYELSVNGMTLAESNRTQTGAVTIREAGQARVTGGLSDYNHMNADGSWNDFIVENYKTGDGYDITISGYPQRADFYQAGIENRTQTEQIVTGSSLQPKLDGNGNPLYQTAKGGEYKTDVYGNPIVKLDTATGSDAEGRIPYGETLYYRFKTKACPSGSAAPGDLSKWGETIDGDYLTDQTNDMLGQLRYKAVSEHSPWAELKLTGTTNEQAAGEIMDWFTANSFFDCGTVESVYEKDGTYYARLLYDYSAVNEDYPAVYDLVNQALYVHKTADVDGGPSNKVGYWLEYQKGSYSLKSKTVSVKEKREIPVTVPYGEDLGALIQTVYQPVYETYQPGELLSDPLGNPIPVLERVPVYTQKEVTIQQEKLTPVASVYDAKTGTHTIHVENETDWEGMTEAVRTTYRAVTSQKTIVYEGQEVPYNQYLTDIAGAAVSAYATVPSTDAGSYIKTRTLIYPGQNLPAQDGGTKDSPVQVLQRAIKQSIRITKDISQASYDGVNTYGSLHNDPLTVLLGLFQGGGSAQGTKLLNQFKFKAYLKSNLENIYVDEAGNIVSEDIEKDGFKGDVQKIYLPPRDGSGRRLLEIKGDGTYDYTKFIDAMQAADRKSGGTYPAEVIRQFAIDYYDVDVYKKEILEAEPGLNSDVAYDKALDRAENEARAYLDSFAGLDTRLSIAWDQDAGGGADGDRTTIQCNTKSGKDDYYNNSIMLPYGTYVIAEQTPADIGKELANRHYGKDAPREITLPFIPDISIDVNTGETEVHDQIGNPFYRYDSKDTPEDLVRKYKIRFNGETSVILAHGQDGDFEVYKYGLDKDTRPGHSLTSTKPYEAEYMDGRNDAVKDYYAGYTSQSEKAGTADRVVYNGYETDSGQLEVRDNVPTMSGVQSAIEGKFASMLVPWTVLPPAVDRVNPDTGNVETLVPSGSGEDFNFVAFAQEDFEDVYYSSRLRIEKRDAETGENVIHDGALFKIYAAKRDVKKNGSHTVTGTGDVLFGEAVDWQGNPVADADGNKILYPRVGEINDSSTDLPVRMDREGVPQYDQTQLIKQNDQDGRETGIFKAYSTVREVVIDKEVRKVPVGYIEICRPLGAGAYVLVEIQAPKGYTKSRPVAFEVYSDHVTYYHDKRNPDGTTKGWEPQTAAKYQYAIPIAGETNKFRTETVSQIPIEDYPSKIEIHKVEDGDSMVGNENVLQKTDAQGQTEQSGGFDREITVNDTGDRLVYKVSGRKEKLEERGDVRDITYDPETKEWYGYVTKAFDGFSEHMIDGTEKDLKAMPGVKLLYQTDGTFTGKGIRFDVTVPDAELALYQGVELEKTGDHEYKGVEAVWQNGKVVQLRNTHTGTHKEIRITGQDSGPARLSVWDTVDVENPPVNLFFYDLDIVDTRPGPDSGELTVLDSRGNRICYADSQTGMAYVYDDYGRMIAYPVSEAGEKQLLQSIQVMENGDAQTIYRDKQTVDDENGLPIYYQDGRIVTKDERWTTNASTDPYGNPETDRAAHTIARLPFGAYILQEERVPYDRGYIQAPYMGMVLKDTEEVQKYFLQNDFTKTAFAKLDVRTQREIKGTGMTLYHARLDADGNPVKEQDGIYRKGEAYAAWLSGYAYSDSGDLKQDATGQPIPTAWPHWIDHIPAGPYVLEETICPYEQGYVQSAPVNLDVKESGHVQSFEMEDDFTSLDIRKYDTKNEDVIYQDSEAYLTLYRAMRDGQGKPVIQDGIPQYEEKGKLFTFRAATYKDGQDVGATGRVEPDAGGNHPIMKYDYDFQPIPNTVQGRYYYTETGTVRLEYLPVGDYVLAETGNPPGYATADPLLITVKDKGHLEEIQHAEIRDKPLRVDISKVNITGGREVNGAKLTVLPVDSHGNVSEIPLILHQPTSKGQYQDVTAAWVSGLDGVYTEEDGKAGLIPAGFETGDLKPHMIEYIPEGEYILREEETPYGFLRSGDVPFTILDTPVIQKAEMINRIPDGILKMVKSDADNPEEKLQGAEFRLVNQTLKQVCETVITDDRGQAQFGPQPIGTMDRQGNFTPYTYRCEETKAAPGHMLTLKPYEFQFEYKNMLTDLIVLEYNPTNDSNRVMTEKLFGDTRELLEGVTLRIERLTAEEDTKAMNTGGFYWELIEEWVTGKQGHCIKNLKAGKYRLTEIKAPEGFKLLAAPIVFTIRDGMEEIPCLTMRNYSTIVEIQKIEKGTDTLIAGARLSLIKENSGDIIREWTSEEEKGQTFHGLEQGIYIIREIQAPDGYEKAPDMKITVEEDIHSIQVFRFENQVIPSPGGDGNDHPGPVAEFILFKKVDTLGNVLEGAEFTFYDQKGTVIAASTSDKEGRIRIKKPRDGTYTFKETKAPSGYSVCPDIFSFTVSGPDIIRGTYEIVNHKREVTVTKLDGAAGSPLEGAALRIEKVSGENGQVLEGITGTDGTLVICPDEPGTYLIREITPPEGYAIHSAGYEFTVEENGQVSGNTTLYNWKKEVPPRRIGKITAVYKMNGRFGKGFFHFGTNLKQKIQTGDTMPILAMAVTVLLSMAGFFISIRKRGTRKWNLWKKAAVVILLMVFAGVFFPGIIMAAPNAGGRKGPEIEEASGKPPKPSNEVIYVSDEIIYPEMEGIDPIPQAAWIWAYDSQTGKGQKVLLPLKEYCFTNERWKEGFRLDLTVTDYGADGYLLGEELVRGGEELLCGHEKDLLSQAGLSEEAYRIEMLQWKGDSYEKDGVRRRDFTAIGSKRVADCNAIYGGDVNKIVFADKDLGEGRVQDGDKVQGGGRVQGRDSVEAAQQGLEWAGNEDGAGNAGRSEWYVYAGTAAVFAAILTAAAFILKKRNVRYAPTFIPALFLAAFIAGSGLLLKTVSVYGEGRDYYSTLRAAVYKDKGVDAVQAARTSKAGQSPQSGRLAPLETLMSPTDAPLDFSGNLPEIDEETLRQINPEYQCWISIPGTRIDYPVVQHGDNQYYLTHNFNKEEHISGSIFADCTVVPLAEAHTVIYGHNMRDGSMFAELKKYMNESFFEQNPSIRLFSHGSWKEYLIYSCQIRGENDAGAYRTNLLEEERRQFLKEMKRMSLYDTGLVPEGDEQMITLSTCINKNRRLIVQALLKNN